MAGSAKELSGAYLRRDPGSGVLYEILSTHLETFLATGTDERWTGGLPAYVVCELRAYLGCGILAHGFARFHCFHCHSDVLVAFSCKGRGFCPSCGGRRMAESAAHLVDHVLPDVPVRQWVISFPWVVRYLLARRPALCSAVRRVFMRAVSGFYKDRAAAEGITGGRTGAVNRIQRFGSSLNLNVHFHALLLDGVYTAESPFARPVFHAARELEDAEVAVVVERVRARVLRLLRRRGYLRDEGDGGDEGRISLTEDHEEQGLLSLFQAASIQGLVAQGPDAGSRLERIGRLGPCGASFAPSPLCAEVHGFSLHAAVRISKPDRERLEHLCRYIARPPLAAERLTLTAHGRVRYEFRRPWRDGTTHVEFEPLVFLERLAALVPPPRMHLQTYHGVLAPGSTWRDDVVPIPVPVPVGEGTPSKSCSGREQGPSASTRPRHRYLWADLMRRVFDVEVLRCGVCHSLRRLIAVITQRHVIVKILAHLELETDPPPVQPARAPPQLELAF